MDKLEKEIQIMVSRTKDENIIKRLTEMTWAIINIRNGDGHVRIITDSIINKYKLHKYIRDDKK